jgi:uncharacterized protein with NRDE domain
MCSVSWARSRGRVVVVMNRDERRDRALARPPRRWPGLAGGFLAPVDVEGGGTWIAVRETGVVIALLNHHDRGDGHRDDRQRADGHAAEEDGAGSRRVSRGLLVTALAADTELPDIARLRAAGLGGFASFRLFVGGVAAAPRVFTWNRASLTSHRLDPRRGFLTSSSWNTRAVVAARHARFRAFTDRHPRPTGADLLAFHADAGHPRGTPWAICMAREDARTVSTTVVEAGPDGVSMRYRAR